MGHRLRDGTACADLDRPRLGRAAAGSAVKQLHHVVMQSHSAQTFLAFLTDVVSMEVQFQMRVPSQVLEATLGWPPSDGADVTMLGSGAAGLIEVLDVPQHLRDIAPEGLAALSFLTEDFDGTHDRAMTFASDVTPSKPGFPASSCSSAPWAVCRSNSRAAMPQNKIRRTATPRTPEFGAARHCVCPRPVRVAPREQRDR